MITVSDVTNICDETKLWVRNRWIYTKYWIYKFRNCVCTSVHIDNLVLMRNLLCDIHCLLITINRSLSFVSIEFTFHSWLDFVFEQLLILNVWHFWNSNNSKINRIFTKRRSWVSNQPNHGTKLYNHQVVKVLLETIL